MLRRLNGFFLAVFIFQAAFAGVSFAASDQDVIKKVEQLEAKLKELSDEQQVMLKKQEQLLQQLANLKIWIRRN